jgi:hypothetical protein
MTPTAKVAIAAAALLLALVCAAAWARGERAPREGLWFDRWPSSNERETFAPDAPGSCCGGRARAGSAAASREAAALRVLQGA